MSDSSSSGLHGPGVRSERQHTLGASFSLEGTGLHTGEMTQLTVHPVDPACKHAIKAQLLDGRLESQRLQLRAAALAQQVWNGASSSFELRELVAEIGQLRGTLHAAQERICARPQPPAAAFAQLHAELMQWDRSLGGSEPVLRLSADLSRGAASAVARPTVGPTPVHKAATPSSLTTLKKQSTIPLYCFGSRLPSASFIIPSVCNLTFIKSVGLAMAEAIAPAPPPATIFFHKGIASLLAFGSMPSEFLIGP